MPDCAAISGYVANLGGNCSTDLSTLVQTLPKGTLLHNVCRKQCKEFCPKAAVASTDIGADVETSTKCLEKSCRDASSTFLKSLTGDDMNCSTLAKRPGFTCDADLSKKFSRLPEGTTLKSICQVTCGCYYQFPPYTWRKIGGYDTSMHLTAQPTWYGGALERPPNLNKLCDPGTKYNTTTGLCEDCPSGKYTFHKGRSQCELCQAGTHSSNSRSSNCQARGCAFR